jgi:hypothetical protein
METIITDGTLVLFFFLLIRHLHARLGERASFGLTRAAGRKPA